MHKLSTYQKGIIRGIAEGRISLQDDIRTPARMKLKADGIIAYWSDARWFRRVSLTESGKALARELGYLSDVT